MNIEMVMNISGGLIVEFDDGHRATLTIYGMSCTCQYHCRLCSHIRAALPAYKERKLQLAEDNKERWGPIMYHRLGLDPADYLDYLKT